MEFENYQFPLPVNIPNTVQKLSYILIKAAIQVNDKMLNVLTNLKHFFYSTYT